MKVYSKIIKISLVIISLVVSNIFAAEILNLNLVGPDGVQETEKEDEIVLGTTVIPVSTGSNIYIHDGIAYVKGEDMGKFSLSGYNILILFLL